MAGFVDGGARNAAPLPADRIVYLPRSNGSDDTSVINAKLTTAAAGGSVRGRVGETYLISAPLVVQSGQTLDMTNCTVRLSSSSSCNMVNNAAVTADRSVSDGAITSSTATLTSATANFTASDVGRTVYVAGAAVSGDLLVAIITARNSATSVTINTNASTTVSGAAVSVFVHDELITIQGGYWDRQSAGPASGNVTAHSLRFRHVDGLTVRDLTYTSANGKYGISLADVTQVNAERIRFDAAFSDGIHLAGPASGINIRDISGTTADDLVAITTQEPTGFTAYNDSLGPVSNVVIENVNLIDCGSRGVLLTAGRSASLKHVVVRNVQGTLGSSSQAVLITDDDTSAATAGLVEDILVDTVTATVFNGQEVVEMIVQNAKHIRIRDVYTADSTRTGEVVKITGPNSGSVATAIAIEGIHSGGSAGGHCVEVTGPITIDSLSVERVQSAATSTNSHIVACSGGAGAAPTITDLSIRGVHANYTGSGTGYVLSLGSSVSVITKATITDAHIANAGGGGGVVSSTSTGVLTNLDITNAHVNHTAWIGDLNSTTEIGLANVSYINSSSGVFNVRASAALTIRGSNVNIGTQGSGLAVAGGGTVKCKTLGFACDVSKLTKTDGDLAYNTNAGLGCGAGPVISNGTLWKHLYTGATA